MPDRIIQLGEVTGPESRKGGQRLSQVPELRANPSCGVFVEADMSLHIAPTGPRSGFCGIELGVGRSPTCTRRVHEFVFVSTATLRPRNLALDPTHNRIKIIELQISQNNDTKPRLAPGLPLSSGTPIRDPFGNVP